MDSIYFYAGITVVAVLALVGLCVSMFRRVAPNRALIVYGFGLSEAKIVTGGGTMVYPIIQACDELSLELMSFDVAPEQDLYTSQGIAVSVEAVAQIKVKSDPHSIRTAAEQFLTKSASDRQDLIRLVMEGHLRGITGLLTVEQIVKEPEMVAGRVRGTVADDLTKMGLELVSFTIKKVTDEQDYIASMGRPDVAKIQREAAIAQAEAERDVAMKRANAKREADVYQAQADQERVLAQSLSEAKQAEAMRDLNMKRAEYEASVNEQKAMAEKAYDIASNQAQQKAVAEQVRVQQVEKQEQIRVQELEVQRRELELEATTIKQAMAEQKRIQIMAEAEGQRLSSEASGRAAATRHAGNAEAEVTLARGRADAEIIRTRGEAEAAVVQAMGVAEAEAMQKRADAYERFNEAAMLDRMLASLPEMAKHFSGALASVDKITIVSTGDGKGGGGASALTGEIAKMVAQMPEVVESITGMKISDLMNSMRGIETKAAAGDVTKKVPVRIEGPDA